MQRFASFLAIFLLAMTAACGSGNTTTTNIGLFGNWNVAMYPTGSSSAVYVFALAISQLGGANYSAVSTTYTGSVPVPSNMCLDAHTLTATATTNGSNFTMTITDSSTDTVISVIGSLATQNSTLSGTYSNIASPVCSASRGTMTMVSQ